MLYDAYHLFPVGIMDRRGWLVTPHLKKEDGFSRLPLHLSFFDLQVESLSLRPTTSLTKRHHQQPSLRSLQDFAFVTTAPTTDYPTFVANFENDLVPPHSFLGCCSRSSGPCQPLREFFPPVCDSGCAEVWHAPSDHFSRLQHHLPGWAAM